MSDHPPILTVEQAAELLRCSTNTLYEACRRGEVPHLRIGRLIRIRYDQLMASFGGAGDAGTSPHVDDAATGWGLSGPVNPDSSHLPIVNAGAAR